MKPSQRLAMKYASWWMQCKLANVTELIVGLKPNIYRQTSTTVNSLKSIKLDDLPREASGYLYWKPEKYYLSSSYFFLTCSLFLRLISDFCTTFITSFRR